MNVQWKLAARYLWGRKLRTVLTTMAVIFGVTIIFGMNCILPTFLQVFTSTIQAGTGQIDITVQTASRAPFPAEIIDQVASTEGVALVDGSLRRTVILPKNLAPASNKLTSAGNIIVAGVDPVTALQVRPYFVAEGDFLEENGTGVAVISQALAEQLSLEIGSTLTLPAATGTMEFQVVGLLTTIPSTSPEEVTIPLTDAQTLFNQPGQVNLIEGTIRSDAVLDEVVERLKAQLGEGMSVNAMETGTELFAGLEVANSTFFLFGVLALAMGAFVIYNTFRTVVVERRHDIGMLRALGASRGTIRGLFLIETLIQGIGGSVLGIAGGYLLAVFFTLMINSFGQDLLHIKIGAPGRRAFKPGHLTGDRSRFYSCQRSAARHGCQQGHAARSIATGIGSHRETDHEPARHRRPGVVGHWHGWVIDPPVEPGIARSGGLHHRIDPVFTHPGKTAWTGIQQIAKPFLQARRAPGGRQPDAQSRPGCDHSFGGHDRPDDRHGHVGND